MKKKITMADIAEMLSKDQFIDEHSDVVELIPIKLSQVQYELLVNLDKKKKALKQRINKRESEELQLSGNSGYLINKKENK